jgi:hypothetical protein
VPQGCSDRLSRRGASPIGLRAGLGLVIGLGLVLGAHPAAAQITDEPISPYPDPKLFARGWFAAGEVGAAIPLGQARRAIHGGPSFGVRAGYEFARWAALQVHGAGSTHEVAVAGQPQVGQLLQIAQITGELRLAVPLGAWAITAQGGAGRARLSSNVLGTAGLTDPAVRATLIYGGNLGVDYHSRSRHFSGGLVAGLDKLQRVDTTGFINVAFYLRYTF